MPPAIQSFTLQNGNCNFEANNYESELNLIGKKTQSKITVNNTDIDLVEVRINDKAKVEFQNRNDIKNAELLAF